MCSTFCHCFKLIKKVTLVQCIVLRNKPVSKGGYSVDLIHRVSTPSPLPLSPWRQVEFFDQVNYPSPLHWDRRVIQPNHINLGSSSALAPMWTSPINETNWTNSGGPLVNSLLGGLFPSVTSLDNMSLLEWRLWALCNWNCGAYWYLGLFRQLIGFGATIWFGGGGGNWEERGKGSLWRRK